MSFCKWSWDSTTFYLVIGVLLLTDIVQGRYQEKLSVEKNRKAALNS
ncbi:MAG: hypothetical protein QNL68_10960 [Akkermansiaceae bacterium]